VVAAATRIPKGETAMNETTMAGTVIRADYVKLCYTWLEVPLRPLEAESGWLTLTSDGKVSFFEGSRFDPGAAPRFAADNPLSLRATRCLDLGWGAVRINFGATSRFVSFTGLHTPPGAAGDIETAAGMGLSFAGQSVLGALGQGAGLLSEAKNLLIDNRGSWARSKAAKAAWSAVLAGAIPWQQIPRNA
jgi:hypothetical protein